MDTKRVEKLVRELIIELGEDPTREGLRETPARMARMYGEIFGGYESDAELSVQFSEDSDAVVARDIGFYSVCEHHMLPFFGSIHIAYLPDGKVFGVSKLVRLVEKYSRRLQIQERLTRNIADELSSQGVKGVAVVAEAEHLCMKMRGVRSDARLTSSAFRGAYKDADAREGVMAMIRGRMPDPGRMLKN
ncbi:GTP cyclohydrolase I [Cenarchaeum symbiosum A]|uniref:GTP cyclohydrolase 1 n=1 Tax=Cenarchaeum symbiosum (strain A) TaxID=414004 RepID=A0RYT5_CENSY|nr:GTP cyclohydrolase I [Cenarchaeum symbiosum A]